LINKTFQTKVILIVKELMNINPYKLIVKIDKDILLNILNMLHMVLQEDLKQQDSLNLNVMQKILILYY